MMRDVTLLELETLRRDPSAFSWFDFKPGIKKLILSGTPESCHVSVLWYFKERPGAVALHYHEMTESIFVIDGAQSDLKGKYEQGTFSFNPPGSGHHIVESSGLFLLSYAAPPDFKRTSEISPYENLTIPAKAYDKLPLVPCDDGSHCYTVPLAEAGGMTARFVKLMAGSKKTLMSNWLLVLQGRCTISGQDLLRDVLVVGRRAEPVRYPVTAHAEDCLIFALSFV